MLTKKMKKAWKSVQRGGYAVVHGDSLKKLRFIPDNSVDAIVTDPPYGIEFMGAEWDGFSTSQAFQKWCESWCREALRVLKPGGHIVAFGGTRMWHRLCSAMEDAGFEIRDTLMFMHGQGFPKSMNIGKMIDKAARGVPQGGADPSSPNHGKFKGGTGLGAGPGHFMKDQGRDAAKVLTPSARLWNGWGTALKPAMEPVVLARKPLAQTTVAKQVLKTGTGALNIDGCRVSMGEEYDPSKVQRQQNSKGVIKGAFGAANLIGKTIQTYKPGGRWPANVVLQHSEGCECVGTREVKTGTAVQRNGGGQKIGGNGIYRGSKGGVRPDQGFGTKGKESVEKWRCTPDCPVRLLDKQAEGVSRFYYTAKPRKKERNAGMPKGEENRHPTLKSLDLMRWLCRLVTPKGGLVLDPFVGSGTTVCAAGLEGFRALGIERDRVFARTAYHRASHWLRGRE
jgi:site-specific DNA-methyltransferase (adenine-specific)